MNIKGKGEMETYFLYGNSNVSIPEQATEPEKGVKFSDISKSEVLSADGSSTNEENGEPMIGTKTEINDYAIQSKTPSKSKDYVYSSTCTLV